MNNFIKTLLNARSLKAATRDLTIDQLQEAIRKIEKIIEARKIEAAEAEAAKQAKLAKLLEYKKMFEKDGLNLEDFAILKKTATKTSKKRAPRPAKYAYEDESGNRKTWTGQGRTPSVIKKALDKGEKSLEDFLIK